MRRTLERLHDERKVRHRGAWKYFLRDSIVRLAHLPSLRVRVRKPGMKSPALLVAIFTASALFLHAENSPVRLTVEPIRKTEVKTVKGKPTHDKTQVMSLKIRLDNNSKQLLDGLTVKYWFIGHALGEHTGKALVEGERKAAINPNGKEIVESEVVSKQYVEAHSEMKGKTATKVPASGEKITGYAVRVLKDGKVLGEFYSEPTIKELLKDDAKPVAPAPAKPGAKPAAK